MQRDCWASAKRALAVLQFVVFLTLVMEPLAGAEYTLQQIRDVLLEEYSSIRSFHVKYSSVFECTLPGEPSPIQGDSDWWMEDSRQATLQTFWHRPDEPRTWGLHAYDGEWTQIAVLTSLEPRQVKSLQRYRGEHPENLHPPEYPVAFGLAFGNEPGNLATAMQDPAARLIGTEAVDGHDCVHVETGKVIPRAGKAMFRYSAWLDPTVEWLPRRLVWRWDAESANYEVMTKNGKYAVICDSQMMEFGQFPDSLTGRSRPFPAKIVSNYPSVGRKTLTAAAIEVNAPIPKDVFVVGPSFGTRIVEGNYQNDPRARESLHGGEAAVAAQRREKMARSRAIVEKRDAAIAALQATPQSPATAIDATPRARWPYLWWSVGGSSLLMLGFALLMRKKR